MMHPMRANGEKQATRSFVCFSALEAIVCVLPSKHFANRAGVAKAFATSQSCCN